MSFLKLEKISKFYGDLCVVADFDLSVKQGEFVSLLGPSGCGKTTTLQMIAGFAEPTHGRIHLDGKDITHARPNARGLGLVFQSYALFPHMTVRDNVAFGLLMRKVPRAERDTRVMEALAMVKLDLHANRYPRELSGGQRQRVALARALVIRPPVLLLDEPLSNLDAKLREDMQYELRNIQQQLGTTTIMVTHDQSEALSISDRVVVMEAGRATQIAEPYRIYEHPESQFISTFVGKTNLLDGVVKQAGPQATVQVGEAFLTVDGGTLIEDTAVQVSLRPEKLLPASTGDARLSGEVQSRFFLGSQWMYSVRTPAGDLTVITPNDGRKPHEHGARMDLTWAEDAARVLPASNASNALHAPNASAQTAAVA